MIGRTMAAALAAAPLPSASAGVQSGDALAAWPQLTRLDRCIAEEVRRSVAGRRAPLPEAVRARAAAAALAQCDALVDPAVADFKRISESLAGPSPGATQGQWRATLVRSRLSMARGLAEVSASGAAGSNESSE